MQTNTRTRTLIRTWRSAWLDAVAQRCMVYSPKCTNKCYKWPPGKEELKPRRNFSCLGRRFKGVPHTARERRGVVKFFAEYGWSATTEGSRGSSKPRIGNWLCFFVSVRVRLKLNNLRALKNISGHGRIVCAENIELV